jgi:opine dehydrogenase
MEKIAVLGGGAGARACCADLSLSGHMVNMYELPMFKANIKPILELGGIEVRGAVNGFARLNKVTTDIKQAIEDVDIILIIVPAFGRETFARVCIPHLKDRQKVVFLGSNGGCLQFVKVLRELGVKKNMTLGETQTLPYATRIVGPAESLAYRNRYLLGAAFPAKETEKIVDTLKRLFPSQFYKIIAAESALETMLWHSLGHPMYLICNLSRIDKKEKWLLYSDGKTSSIKKLIEALDKEKEAVMEALGVKRRDLITLGTDKEYRKHWKVFSAAAKGPITLKSRFITEEIPFLAVTVASIGDLIGVPTPLIKAIIKMTSILNETDYWKFGATVERLGISGLNVDEIKAYVVEGHTKRVSAY